MKILRARSRRPLLPLGPRALALLGGFLGTLCLACASAPPARDLSSEPVSAVPAPAGPPLLEKGVPLERELRAGEAHEFRIAFEAGGYARVTVDQTGLDVALRLVGPSGEEVVTSDGVGGRKKPELLSWLSPAGGSFRLSISPREPDGTGLYKVTLEELRPSDPRDRERIAAERATSEADHWLSREDTESKRKALARYEEALPLWRSLGDCHREVDTQNQIGIIHRSLGETQVARSLYHRALFLALECGDRSGEANARNNLAIAYNALGDHKQALRQYQESIRLWEDLKDFKEAGTTLYNFGSYLLQTGEFQAALEPLNRALEIRRNTGDISQALILTAIARAHLELGEAETALDLLGQALELSREQGQRYHEANALQHTASCHLRRGELQKALDLYTEALGLYRLLGERSQEGQVLSNLGATSIYLGDPDQALDYYRQALAIHQAMKSSLWEAYALWDIGWIYDLKQAHEVALEHYAKASEISQAQGYQPTQALALQGMGRTRLAMGQPQEALRLLEEALALYRSTRNALGEINTLVELGRAWQALSQEDRAAELFGQALALSRQRQTLVNEAVAQAAVARLEGDRGNLPAAAKAMEEALRIIESVRTKVAGQRLRASFFASRREYYDFYVDLQMRLHEQVSAGGHLAAAFAASEQGRARALLDLLAEGRIDVRRGIAPELKERETEITRRISWLQTRLIEELSGRTRGESRAAQLEAELSRSEKEREQLEWQIRREHPRYAAVTRPQPLSLERIQDLLDERTALLEYSVGRERSFLFVVTRDRLAGFALPAAEELSVSMESLRQALHEPGRLRHGRYVEIAHRLYQILIQPAAPLLRDKQHLIIAPDGPLLFLSFEALLTSPAPAESRGYRDLPYLILERSVTYVPSASVLAELGVPSPASAPAEAPKLFLGFGDPDYGIAGSTRELRVAKVGSPSPEGTLESTFQDAGLLHPRPLPESRIEVTRIADLYPTERTRLYLGREASEENVKGNPYLKTARRIHFALHGLLNERQPERSGLMLSLDEDPQEDGLLQVYEIFNLELSADLVVLSACETAVGKYVNGEGLLGVSRALLYAGAASVVVSLWRVADDSSAEMMIRFYQHLAQTDDKAEALRQSKLEMIREGQFDHPYHWAPFILIGKPDGSSGVTPPVPARQ